MFGKSTKNEVEVIALDEYLREISKLREEWLDCPDDELWFRGEDAKHASTALIPELYRTEKSAKEVLNKEFQLFEEFKRCGIQYSEFNTDDEWNWYSAMQHHGGPTRLLDWSDGSLMAAHFSMRFKTGREDLKVAAVVYVLDPNWLEKHIDELPATKKRRRIWETTPKRKMIPGEEYEDIWLPGGEDDFTKDPLPDEPLLLNTVQITRRVASQRSQFMVFGSKRNFLSRMADDKSSRIRKLVFPGGCIPKIQTDIRDCGVTESVIFPDLDGMGREARQRWQLFKARR